MATLFRTVSSLARGAFGLESEPAPPRMKYLSQPEAIAVDEALFESFSVDSLMELAGLSVAAAVHDAHPPRSGNRRTRVLCVCGPGNNGGDGLVAARHLALFGYRPTVVYPKKPTSKPLFERLVKQMDDMRIPLVSFLPDDFEREHDVILDAVFGFSFTGAVRPPFDMILTKLAASKLPMVSVDVPSGWHVEKGPPESGPVLRPDVLVSLTAPKQCAAAFRGHRHYLGGRFVPKSLQERFGFEQPRFAGADQILRLDATEEEEEDDDDATAKGGGDDDDEDDQYGAKEKEYYYF